MDEAEKSDRSCVELVCCVVLRRERCVVVRDLIDICRVRERGGRKGDMDGMDTKGGKNYKLGRGGVILLPLKVADLGRSVRWIITLHIPSYECRESRSN